MRHLLDILHIIPTVFFPIPQPTLHFWGSNCLNKLPSASKIKFALSVLILFSAAIVLFKRPTVLAMYLCETTGLLAFFYTIYYGSIRHHGFLFMLFVAWIWISHYSYQKTQILSFLNTPSKINPNIILTTLFGLHLIGDLMAACLEYKHFFSQGQSVAKFIKESKSDKMLIAGAALMI